MILQFNFVTFSLQFFECLWFHLNAVHTHSSLLMVVQSNLTPLYLCIFDYSWDLTILHPFKSYILHPFTSVHIRLHLGLELAGMQYYTSFLTLFMQFFLQSSLMLLYIFTLHVPLNLGFYLTQNQFWDKSCKLPWGQDVCAVRTNRLTESEFDRYFG